MTDIHPLIHILKKEQANHQAILKLKKEEQNALALGEPDKVFQIAEQLTALADEAAALEHERQTISLVIAEELQLESKIPTLKEILAVLPSYNKAELESTGKALLDTVQELQRQNQVNADMLNRSMDTLNQEIQHLVQPQQSGVYAVGGTKKAAQPIRAGLNVRV